MPVLCIFICWKLKYSIVYFICNHMRLYPRYYCNSKIHQPGKCFTIMYFAGFTIYTDDYFFPWTGYYIGSFNWYFHLVCSFIRPGQFIGMGRNLAFSHGGIREVYKTWGIYTDHGIMWKCHLAAPVRLFGRCLQCAECLLDLVPLLFIPAVLCYLRAPYKKLASIIT